MVSDSCQDDDDTVSNYTKDEYTVKEGVVVTFQCGKYWTDAVTIYLNGTAAATWAGSADYSSYYVWTAKKDAKINWAGYNQNSANIYLTETSTVDVTGVTLSQTSASIVEGDTLTLTATVSPADASDKTITWSTSDSSVATVSDGTITAIAPGTAAITATATNGTDDTADDKSATCTLTVRAMTCSFSFPETPFIQNPGWNPLTEGISASGDIPAAKKFVVTASSQNGFKLVSRGGSLSYKLADTGDSSTTYDTATAKTRWEFTAEELKGTGTTKPIGIVIEDYTGRLSGSYTGDVQFTGAIE